MRGMLILSRYSLENLWGWNMMSAVFSFLGISSESPNTVQQTHSNNSFTSALCTSAKNVIEGFYPEGNYTSSQRGHIDSCLEDLMINGYTTIRGDTAQLTLASILAAFEEAFTQQLCKKSLSSVKGIYLRAFALQATHANRTRNNARKCLEFYRRKAMCGNSRDEQSRSDFIRSVFCG